MSTFVLPQSYINIENDELAYIDGGFDIISVKWVGAIINAARYIDRYDYKPNNGWLSI